MQSLPDIQPKHRAPQQGRSRASFERMVVTAEKLMTERGSADFTLNDVARIGKVSIGSIYCRFDSKEDLVHEVQTRVLTRVDEVMLARLAAVAGIATGPGAYTREIVEAVAESLREFADALRPFMMRANSDSVVAELGKASHARTAAVVRNGFLSHRDAIHHPDPDQATEYAFGIMYAALARYLGFGTSPEAAGEGDWTALKRELARMVHAYLFTRDRLLD